MKKLILIIILFSLSSIAMADGAPNRICRMVGIAKAANDIVTLEYIEWQYSSKSKAPMRDNKGCKDHVSTGAEMWLRHSKNIELPEFAILELGYYMALRKRVHQN